MDPTGKVPLAVLEKVAKGVRVTFPRSPKRSLRQGLCLSWQLEAHLEHRILKYGSYMVGGQKSSPGCFSEESMGRATLGC